MQQVRADRGTALLLTQSARLVWLHARFVIGSRANWPTRCLCPADAATGVRQGVPMHLAAVVAAAAVAAAVVVVALGTT